MSAEDAAAELSNVECAEPTGLACAVGFFFSFRILIVFVSVRVFGVEPRTGAAINLTLGFFLLVLVCFQSVGNARRTFHSMLRLSVLRWMLVFLLFSGCSLAWSVTISLPASFAYWCGITADVTTVALLLRTGSVSVVSNSLMKGFVLSTCCIALIAWILPADPNDLRLGDQEFFNTNQIGNLCAFAILLAQILTRRKDGKWGPATLFLTVTLLRSLSKATLAAFLVSETFLVLRDRSIARKAKMLLAAAAALVVLVFGGLFQAYYTIYTTTGNQAETLTGRTAIWAYVLDAALDKPWIGHGFDSMWKVVPPFAGGQFEARHAENELLQQFYTYGLIGLVLLAGLYGSLFLQIRKLPRSPLKTVFFSTLLYVLVRGLVEAEPFDLLLPLWSIILLALVAEQEGTVDETPVSVARRISDEGPHPLDAITRGAEAPSRA
jgi:exopolysaccharide production protein ExoQ